MNDRRTRANAIRALSMDAVQQAGSGHPGAPMGMADIAEVLWNDHLSHNPANPHWANRDRFVLSNGHGSMLLYSLLHLSGYELPIEEIKNLRRLHSKTPGHPEHDYAPGVETTTGPLGQGLANAVGMALAEKTLAAQFNRDGHEIVDHRTWVFAGDGCLMEGISHEVCSLAGTLGLGKLTLVYDDNGISIDGEVKGWFSDDTPARFAAYGWHVVAGVDGHDAEAVGRALAEAATETDRPSIVCTRTTIGFGAPNKGGTSGSHGSPLGDDEIALVREELGWNHPPFEVPNEVYAAWNALEAGERRENEWQGRLDAYREAHPDLAAELERRLARKLPEGWAGKAADIVREAAEAGESLASRKASQGALDAFGPHLPELLGGSADLAGSNNTLVGWLERRGGRPGRELRVLRGARVRHERDGQRGAAARRLPPLRRHLPDLLRLRPERPAHGGADAHPEHLRADPRLGRPRRRRADPPAGRAARLAQADPPHGRLAPLRRGRDHRRLEGRDRARGGADLPDPEPPVPAAPGPRRGDARRHRARRLRPAPDPGGARGDSHRHRFRGGARGGRRRAPRRRDRGARRLDAQHRRLRRPGRHLPRLGAAALGDRPGGGRGRCPRSVAQVRRAARGRARNRGVRRVGGGGRGVRALRVHPREARRARAGACAVGA